MPDGYTLRNLAMFLYPLYGYFFYRFYKYPKWIIAYPLAIFLLWSIPWQNYYNKLFIVPKIINNYQLRKSQEHRYCQYVWENIIPGMGSVIHTSDSTCDDNCKAEDITFRLLIWEDMLSEMWRHKAIFGMGLSHPLRSHQIEMLNMAKPEWSRDGWISAHNSYLYILYRIGIFGLFGIILLFRLIYIKSTTYNTVEKILLYCILYFLLLGFWSEQFQVPYHAIPMWVTIGIYLS